MWKKRGHEKNHSFQFKAIQGSVGATEGEKRVVTSSSSCSAGSTSRTRSCSRGLDSRTSLSTVCVLAGVSCASGGTGADEASPPVPAGTEEAITQASTATDAEFTP